MRGSPAAIESLAENFSDGVVAPVFWYLMLGLPGLFAYKMTNTLDSMIGHRRRAIAISAGRRRGSTISLNLVRRRAACCRRRGDVSDGRGPAVRSAIMLRDGRKHASPNAGWPEAAMAGALGIALAGPRHYHEGAVDDPYLGDGSPIATPRH